MKHFPRTTVQHYNFKYINSDLLQAIIDRVHINRRLRKESACRDCGVNIERVNINPVVKEIPELELRDISTRPSTSVSADITAKISSRDSPVSGNDDIKEDIENEPSRRSSKELKDDSDNDVKLVDESKKHFVRALTGLVYVIEKRPQKWTMCSSNSGILAKTNRLKAIKRLWNQLASIEIESNNINDLIQQCQITKDILRCIDRNFIEENMNFFKIISGHIVKTIKITTKIFANCEIILNLVARMNDGVKNAQKIVCEFPETKEPNKKSKNNQRDIYKSKNSHKIKVKKVVTMSKTNVTSKKEHQAVENNINVEQGEKVDEIVDNDMTGERILEYSEFRKISSTLITELDDIFNKTEMNSINIGCAQVISMIRYILMKLSGKLTEDSESFFIQYFESNSNDQTKSDMISIEAAPNLCSNEFIKNLRIKSIFNPSKNVQVTYVESTSDINVNLTNRVKCIRSDNLNEKLIRNRETFLKMLELNPFYKNKNFKTPWKVMSTISENIIDEIFNSIQIQME